MIELALWRYSGRADQRDDGSVAGTDRAPWRTPGSLFGLDGVRTIRLRGTIEGRLIVALMLAVGCSTAAPREQAELPEAPPPAPSGAIEGTVVDGQGAAVPGAFVVTMPRGYEVVADAQGSFVIDRLDPGEYALQSAAEGFASDRLTGVVVTDGEQTSVEIVLQPADASVGRVEVVVYGPDELPLEGALVSDGLGQTVLTDAAGEAVLVGLSGQRVDVTVSDPADALWPRTHRELDVPALGNVQLQTILSGRPPAGATMLGSNVCSICHPDAGAAHDLGGHGNALSESLAGVLAGEFAAGVSVPLTVGLATLADGAGGPEVRITPLVGADRVFAVDGVIGASDGGSVPYTTIGEQAYPLPVAWVAARTELGNWPDAQARWAPFEVERWLDPTGAFQFADGLSPAPSGSADAQCFTCHATGMTLSPRPDGGVDLASTFGPGPKWGEAGVGCERCHGPGSAHMAAPADEKPFRITRPDRLDADRANEVCSQCHGRHRSLGGDDLPFPYDPVAGLFQPGGEIFAFATSDYTSWPSGAADVPNAQSDELALSAHGPGGVYTLRCIDCHDPHGEATDAGGSPIPASMRVEHRDNTLCASCHLGWTWGGVQGDMEAHPNHFNGYDPAGPTQIGRCTGCHMPATTARLAYGAESGAGDLDSHLFVALPPQDTVDVFDALGQTSLPVGSFPTHACHECHAWGQWREADAGSQFIGPNGDPTNKAIHELFQNAYGLRFP